MKKLMASAWLLASVAALAQQAPIPAPNDLLGRAFSIRDRWVIGGNGTWDYLTLDPAARQLFITHQSRVQVVDIGSGQVSGDVTGLANARAVVLDPNGSLGYVTDSSANRVISFDRRLFRIARWSERLRASPRALVLDPQSGMLFAFGPISVAAYAEEYGARTQANLPTKDPCGSPQSRAGEATQSIITILDPEKLETVAQLRLCGTLGSALADGDGQIYFIRGNRDIVQFNASMLLDELRGKDKAAMSRLHASLLVDNSVDVDLRVGGTLPEYQTFRLSGAYREGCSAVHALAIDPARRRLFAACTNQYLEVLSSDRGQRIAALTIGPGVDAMAYDRSRGLLFTANGDGYGSITIIRVSGNDDYTVVQNLPTMERARTMALDPSTGSVYLVTDLHGANLRSTPSNGIGKLRLDPVADSFQVLVIGN